MKFNVPCLAWIKKKTGLKIFFFQLSYLPSNQRLWVISSLQWSIFVLCHQSKQSPIWPSIHQLFQIHKPKCYSHPDQTKIVKWNIQVHLFLFHFILWLYFTVINLNILLIRLIWTLSNFLSSCPILLQQLLFLSKILISLELLLLIPIKN